jgi:hypothetical protein
MFALNYEQVSAPAALEGDKTAAAAATTDEVTLEAPGRVAAGELVTVSLTGRGTGAARALSIRLSWNPAVVAPVSQAAGDWLTAQSGLALSSAPGVVDAAVLRAQGLTGEGVLATVTFQTIAAGDPQIRILSLDGRDAHNRKLSIGGRVKPALPAVTQLALPAPNPFGGQVTIAFSLATPGPADLVIYGVNGRRVRTLARGAHDAGEYAMEWDGRDDGGAAVQAGVYYVHLATAQGRFTRTVTYLRQR